MESGRQKTKENIIPGGKVHLVENSPKEQQASDNSEVTKSLAKGDDNIEFLID